MRNLKLSAAVLSSMLFVVSNTSHASDAAISQAYADAYKTTQETGKPLVVLIGADWCPYCQTMKTSVMPQVAAHGRLQKVSFAYVNSDQQSALASKLLSGNSIPQMVMYEKTADGWKQSRLIGGQSATAVEEFIGASKREIAAVQAAATPNQSAIAAGSGK